MMGEIAYTQVGDYLVPNITLGLPEHKPLGKFGKMRRSFLEKHKNLMFCEMCLTGELWPHLWEVDEAADRMYESLMKSLLEKNPAPDKATDQMGWVQHMNMLRAQAEELVIADLITV